MRPLRADSTLRPLRVALLVGATWACAAPIAQAQDGGTRRASPYDYGMRTALFPVAFQAGISQSSFGSALRSELDLGRYFTLHASGRLGWAVVGGERDVPSYGVRAGLSLSLLDGIEYDELAGTAYPKGHDAATIGGQRRGTDADMEGTPISQSLGGPALTLPERAQSLRASVRHVHALRLFYEHARAVERLRPSAEDGSRRLADNHLNVLSLGYGWSSHWNLSSADAGERTLGFRRFYLDALFTLPELYSASWIGRPVPGDDGGAAAKHFGLGARLGMEGAFDALLPAWDGFGFGYSLEAGALPGDSGFEGYFLVGLGVELDAATYAR